MELCSADRTAEFPFRRDREGRFQAMSVRTAVASETREHQTEAVQQFRSGSECAADSRNARPLMERKRGGNIEHFVDDGFCRLGHAAARISREGFQITARTFRIEYSERKGRLSRTGDSGDRDDSVQRNVDVDVLQIVNAGAANLDAVDHQ